MSKFKHDLLLRIVKTINTAMVTVPFALCWYLYYAGRTASPFYAKGNLLVVALFFVLYIVFGRVYGRFSHVEQRISEIVYAQFLAAGVSDLIMYVVIWLLSKHLPNILPGVAALAGQVLLSALWALLAHRWYFATFPRQATAIIYDHRQGMEKLIGQYGLDNKYAVTLTASAQECIDDLSMLDGIKTVFMSGIHSHDRNIILKHCVANDITVFVIPRIGRHDHVRRAPDAYVPPADAESWPLYGPAGVPVRQAPGGYRGLAVCAGGAQPDLHRHGHRHQGHGRRPGVLQAVRLTKDGRRFHILKFRSMRVDAEKDGVARLSTGSHDDRVTPVGKVIRACRIDELPQLFNILGAL